MDEIHGGSAYGAGRFIQFIVDFHLKIYLGTYSGQTGARQPSQLELQVAEHQGTHFTRIATALKIGRAALPPKEANPPDPKQDEGQTKSDRPPSAKK